MSRVRVTYISRELFIYLFIYLMLKANLWRCLIIKYNKGINFINKEIELYIYINGSVRKRAFMKIDDSFSV